VLALSLALAVLAVVPSGELGAELHLAALVLVLAPHAGLGLDALLAGERRAALALATAAGAAALCLAAVGVLRHGDERTLLAGGLGIAALAGACVLAWQRSEGRLDLGALAIVALAMAPGVGALPVTAPLVDRALVADPPAWARAAAPADHVPARVFRPVAMFEGMTPRAGETPPQTLGESIATLAGSSAAKWGIATARTVDPARLASHDRVWLAAASVGSQLFERYGIALAILPSSIVGESRLVELGRRGTWSLVRYPVSPVAALVYEWIHVAGDSTAIQRLFPAGAARGLDAGVAVIHGTGTDNQDEPSAPEPCTVTSWSPGAIELACVARESAFAVVSSTAAAGWSVTVDDRAVAWQTADVLRRAVAVAPGAHRVSWRYRAPGLFAGAIASVVGLALVIALSLLRPRTRDRASRATT
jgi:hypothetical protein